ncbi:uncharacterized protein LOC114159372 [Xiphophorus couchianus]|uniref:uncharacterized protein LOC114159372 n=1 Tax=Xiphophorus couchianus TaxID=32473 RepID=UPI001016D76F|nr:uncharacterized protein LOC114159372 [Xiphophorus couchianus]XP_032443678.1 uncharacterized protein LOC116735727 isoform X2 [Xiphophorus hellerii]
MKRMLWLPFLLMHLAETGHAQKSERCLFQQQQLMWKNIGEKAVLNCSINPHCSAGDLEFEWFLVKKDSHKRLMQTHRYNIHENLLNIDSVNGNDTGLYLCAAKEAECCQPFVANGTLLVVGGRPKVMRWRILVWVLFTLLAIYSLALVTLIIVRKHDYNLTISKKSSKTETPNSVRKKTQFRDVLQELHSKSMVNKRKQNTRGNGCQVGAVSGNGNISTDDIYQNV